MTDPKLLGDMYEFLLRIREHLDDAASYEYDGEGKPAGNTEAHLLAEVEDGDFTNGLLTRVERAIASAK